MRERGGRGAASQPGGSRPSRRRSRTISNEIIRKDCGPNCEMLEHIRYASERNEMKLNPALVKVMKSKQNAGAKNKCSLTDEQNILLKRHDYIKERCLTWGKKKSKEYDGCVMLLSSSFFKHLGKYFKF